MQLAPSTDQDWTRFSGDLALCLADLDEDEFLILSSKNATYYVQFAAQGKFGMRAEAACNSYIEPPQAVLTVEDYEQMATLGWNRATHSPEQEQSDPHPTEGSPNFFLDAADPVDFKALASLAVRTLREVYRVGHPGNLQYKSFAKDFTQIRFPTLRVKRER